MVLSSNLVVVVNNFVSLLFLADDHWKFLAERLGMDNNSIKYLDSKRVENPADEVLRYWEVKANSTVGALYDILVDIGCPFIADLL